MNVIKYESSLDPFERVPYETSHHVNGPPPIYSMNGSTILPSSLNTPNQSRASTPGLSSTFNQIQLPYVIQAPNSSRIESKYPTSYIIFHSIFVIILSLAQIILQALFYLNYERFKFDLGGGLVSGGYYILTIFLTLLTINCRSYCMIVTSIVMHVIGIFATFLVIFICNIIGITQNACLNTGSCGNDQLFLLTATLLGLGIILVILSLFYVIFIQLRLIGTCCNQNERENPNVHLVRVNQLPYLVLSQ